jgi:transaldolase
LCGKYLVGALACSFGKRNGNHIIACAEAGADVCTCPLSSILALLKHPLTDLGLKQFLADAEKMRG